MAEEDFPVVSTLGKVVLEDDLAPESDEAPEVVPLAESDSQGFLQCLEVRWGVSNDSDAWEADLEVQTLLRRTTALYSFFAFSHAVSVRLTSMVNSSTDAPCLVDVWTRQLVFYAISKEKEEMQLTSSPSPSEPSVPPPNHFPPSSPGAGSPTSHRTPRLWPSSSTPKQHHQ